MNGYIILPLYRKKVVFIRKNIRLLFVFVLPVYFYIVQSSIQNKHTHFYSNGIVVTHSHPLDAKNNHPIGEHEHSQTEICLFQQLKIDSFINAVELNVEIKELFVERNCIFTNEEEYGFTITLQSLKRGPPSHSRA